MQKKKILFVIHQMNHGGVQKALISALNALDYEMNEVTLYIRKNRIQLLQEINKNVNRVIVNEDQTHYYRKPYAAFLLFAKCICQMLKMERWVSYIQQKLVEFINCSQMKYEKANYFSDEEEFDVAISYIQGYTAQFVAEHVNAKKKVMFYHGSTDENHALHESVMPSFDCIVGVNKEVQKVLEELYPDYSEKMTFIENYVDAEKVRQYSKAYDISKTDGKFQICTCGRLTPVKGFDLAIDAAEILKENGILFLWYFIGDGSERNRLEQVIAEKQLEEDIKITGMLDNPYPYIAGCDIYVQASYEESYGLAVKEALVLKCPVITTATVGGQALVKQGINGLIAEISGEALAETISQLVTDSEEYSRIKECLKKINYENEFDEYRNKWENLLGVS